MKNHRKASKILCITSSILLLAMAIFHGSGFNFINELIQSSNSSELIKRIFPVLFILPSIQLFGLGAFGVITLFLEQQANKILIPLSILVFIDALFAFYLNAWVPGVILMIPAILFLIVSYLNSTKIMELSNRKINQIEPK